MNKKKEGQSPSEIISAFLQLVNTATKEYEVAYEYMNEYDKELSDIVHKGELAGRKMKQNERAKAWTEMCHNREDRRYWKNKVDQYKPINELIVGCPELKKTIEQLKQVLGKVRKAEAYLDERVYKPKAKKNQTTNLFDS